MSQEVPADYIVELPDGFDQIVYDISSRHGISMSEVITKAIRLGVGVFLTQEIILEGVNPRGSRN